MWPKRYNAKIGFDVSRESIERLEIYYALLLKWQKAINLVSPKTLNEAWVRHFLDSAQLHLLIKPRFVSCESVGIETGEGVSRESNIIADIGSGAGFPGLVLAILNANAEFHLIESDERKCQFLKTVSRETGVNIVVHTARIEASMDVVTPNIVTARALSDLSTLLCYIHPWVLKNSDLRCFFMKGFAAQQEIQAARSQFEFNVSSHLSLSDSQGCILEISNVKSLS